MRGSYTPKETRKVRKALILHIMLHMHVDICSNANYCTTYGVRDGSGENDTRMLLGSIDASYYATTSQRVFCTTDTPGGLNDASYGFTSSFGDLA